MDRIKRISAALAALLFTVVLLCTYSPEGLSSASLTFDQQLAAFPESYRPYITALHNTYPNWVFEAVPVQDTWSSAIAKELAHEDTNLVPNSSNRGWIRNFTVYDRPSWVPASKQIIEYFMDPRNFLTVKGVFQFEKLSYDATTQNESGVRAIFGTNQGLLAMTSYVLTAASQSNSSAYLLASRIKQEVADGSTGIINSARGDLSVSCPPLTSGGVSPCFMSPQDQIAALQSLSSRTSEQETWLQGLLSNPQVPIPAPAVRYYNVYNIGAIPNPSQIDGARINAIKYAMTVNAQFDLPWDSAQKAVTGGAKYIAANYIAKGQDTMYFQKFAVTGDAAGLYSHQYMQNAQAASSEALRYYNAYNKAGMLGQPFVFRIPVYTGMPNQVSGLPSVVSSANQSTALPATVGTNVMSSGTSSYNIRTLPSTSASSLGKTGVSASFAVQDIVVGETTSYGNLWYKIQYNGQTGYIIVDLNGQIVPLRITLNSNGGSSLPAIYVNQNGLATPVADPKRSGYIFVGWYTDQKYTKLWNFSADVVTGDMTLYARWVDAGSYDKISKFVTRFYDLCLSRTPDSTGLKAWTLDLASGQKKGADVAYGFVFSPEFTGRNVDNVTYLTILYKAFFNRDPDPMGLSAWTDALNRGMSRYYVLHGFTNSQEFKDLCGSYAIASGELVLTNPADLYPDITAFVTRFYVQCLGRTPDSSGITDWVGRLQTGKASGADVANGFVFSAEFTGKNLPNDEFVRIMYRAFFDREPDIAGLNDWVNQLNQGQTRKNVLMGFVNSKEFEVLCTKYAITKGSL